MERRRRRRKTSHHHQASPPSVAHNPGEIRYVYSMKAIAFIGYILLALIAGFVILGCTAHVQEPPAPMPGGWPNPRLYHDTDWDGNRLLAIVNQVGRPIVVAISCDDGQLVDGVLVPGLSAVEYYIPKGVVCFLRDWKVVVK